MKQSTVKAIKAILESANGAEINNRQEKAKLAIMLDETVDDVGFALTCVDTYGAIRACNVEG